MNRYFRLLAGASLFATAAATIPAFAQPAAPAAKPAAAQVKIPNTPQDHLALAEEYRKKAAAYRAEAEMHRQMLEEYKKGVATGPAGKAPENPYLKKMKAHCEGYIKKAEEMAKDADGFAQYHRWRAAELEGK